MNAPGKLFVFVPTYQLNGKEAIRNRTRASLEALEWDGEKEVLISHSNPYPVSHGQDRHRSENLENVLVQYTSGRIQFLETDADWFMTFEHDMIVPPDAALRLAKIDKPVAYGVYMLRHGPPRLNTWRHIRGPGVGMSLSIWPAELASARRQKVAKVSGVGFGCTLIKREILERFEFHRSENGGHPSPDVPFSTDLQRAGIEQWADFELLCGHIKPDGSVLWPEWATTEEGISMATKKYVALQSFNGQVGRQLMQFTAGDEYLVPEEEAGEWLRAGFLKEKVEKPKRAPAKPKAAPKKGLSSKSLKE